MGATARERYEIRLVDPSAPRRALGWLVVIASNLLLEGNGARGTGGTRAEVIDRASGRVLIEVTESIDDDSTGAFARLQRDLDALEADDFRVRWIDDPSRPSNGSVGQE